MRGISALILVAPILMASMGTTFAHAYLQSASPPVDSTITQPPKEVTIVFTGAIEPQFSTIEVTGQDGKRVDNAKPHLIATDATRLAVGVGSLSSQAYTVVWHATSVDTHKTEGQFQFTVSS